MSRIERDYKSFLASATADENVVGLVESGSRGAGAFVTERSDFDVFLILREADDRWRFDYGSSVEIVALTLAAFGTYALPGGHDAWNRPAFLFAQVEIDRLEGGIARIVERKRRLTPAETTTLAAEFLDDYINALYRSLRNLEAGRALEGRLDAAESMSPFLATAFALEGRVRPFNKWLRYDLGREPLELPDLPRRVDRIRRDGAPDEQRALFRDVERLARAKGHGPGIDSWQPHLAWLLGDSPGNL